MKILFIDDSQQKDEYNKKVYLGHGGFCIDARNIKDLYNDYAKIREDYEIPWSVESKWSPDKDHYFRGKKFKSKRQIFYKETLLLLNKYNVNILCVIHDINECYGPKYHKWATKQTNLWAIKEQFKYLIERFERPYLEDNDDLGIIIADHYSDRKEESNIAIQSNIFTDFGTEFQKHFRICTPPLFVSSRDCRFIQIADLIIGITVGFFGNNKYALKLFDDISLLFLRNPNKDAIGFDSTISSSVVGFGLKLFPESFSIREMQIFEQIDKKYIYTDKGIKEREQINDFKEK